MKKLKDKIAIVTGGASGLGRALCEQLGARGAMVIVTDINTPGATKVCEGILASGGKARASHLDVTSEEEVRKLIEQTVAKPGHHRLSLLRPGSPGVWRLLMIADMDSETEGPGQQISAPCRSRDAILHSMNYFALRILTTIPVMWDIPESFSQPSGPSGVK
ncbi:MAG: SDR family NAD(P)-dependent oxidoreductase [Deltaproteobacteria bacterium]|nr:SDR family NAD(P)-dependent oxidoreductase [Deltaproteobacteria bacterium]